MSTFRVTIDGKDYLVPFGTNIGDVVQTPDGERYVVVDRHPSMVFKKATKQYAKAVAKKAVKF